MHADAVCQSDIVPVFLVIFDKDSLKVGCFAAAGLQFWFNKYIGVGADIRYDKVFDNVTTRYSDLNLDTWNTDLKFLFRF